MDPFTLISIPDSLTDCDVKHRLQIPLRHFFATPPTPCPYLPGRLERKVVTLLAGDDPDGLHNALSQAGVRRSQDLAYRPACEHCNACVPVRVPVSVFQPDPAQRPLLRNQREILTRYAERSIGKEWFHTGRSCGSPEH